jgi:hypothetical protein
LLAIVASFENWRHFLEGAQQQVTIYTDYKNLEYFMSAKNLNWRQARWNMAFSHFNFIITYRPGSQQGKTYTSSHRAYLAPNEGDAVYDQQRSIFLKPKRLVLHSLVSSPLKDLSIIEEIQRTLGQDPLVKNVQRQMKEDKGEDFQFKDGLLFFQGLLYVPPRLARLKVL